MRGANRSERVREAMQLRGWSYRDLSAAVGVEVSSLWRLVNDPKHDPRLSTVIAVADALHMTLSELAGHLDPDAERDRLAVENERLREKLAAVRRVVGVEP